MSLRDDFAAVQKNGGSRDMPWQLHAVSGRFYAFAHDLPEIIAAVMRRIEGGENIRGDDSFTVKVPVYEYMYDIDKKLLATMAALPGYRALFNFASDPQNDIALTVEIKEGNERGRFMATYSATVDPSRPFSDSTLILTHSSYRAAQSVMIGRSKLPEWAQHNTKPKAKLSLPPPKGSA